MVTSHPVTYLPSAHRRTIYRPEPARSSGPLGGCDTVDITEHPFEMFQVVQRFSILCICGIYRFVGYLIPFELVGVLVAIFKQ